MASKEAIAKITREIFGSLPNKNIRTGHQILKKRHIGKLEARYYMDEINIDAAARKVFPGYTTEIQARRLEKLDTLRRRGKGPPKKGSGKRSK
mmetsp:Transcript_475/g.763  ORF Transcript_475/g.763 Transcript_475/m.763 type:complete len:93 (-) Transcript_475:270-548(-)|eukprot:CAMPEP_0184854998 /NCGR_PEP_ID=MMETSP0580-20130426/353_1 /TAXON_ID=1118495 /ORGANISM="Dactyliosolen fragilissimus" /LENGTH=92 /DNA_ID=CAMNT_0027349401 /DNA_START=71 /DNA_END=349 /DNA_ORIENTATION=+